MTRLPWLALLISTIVGARYPAAGAERPVTLASNGHSSYVIVIPREASGTELKAASELALYIRKIGDAVLPIVRDTAGEQLSEILIGNTNRKESSIHRAGLTPLEEDGFTIRTSGSRLAILGGTRKGSLYGVYALLEDLLGCRMYAPGAVVIPKRSTITLPALDITRVPTIRHREIHYLNAMDREYSDWHKLNSGADRQREWGMWVHTFNTLVPAAEYYASHPEYYALIGGRRVPSGQLCLSQPEVFSVLTAALRQRMAQQPEARYWSVSQNDNYNECQCDSCRAQNARYGGSSGTMIAFVNRVAALFPDKTISTLAYQYTRSAPSVATPAPNVNIMLCSIECNRSRPIATDPGSSSFRKDIGDWGRLTDNIIMWDYVVQFRNLVSPFPNLRVLQPNIQYFVKNRIRMMFQQGCGANVGEFGDLRTYLIAKLLWDPYCNIDSVMADFLDGYYGRAGKEIRRYIDEMHDALERSGRELDIYGYPYDAIRSYLTPGQIKEYSRIFDRAERSVRSDSTLLARVTAARLPLEFAILDIALHDPTPELSYFDKRGGRWAVRPAMRARLEKFVAAAKASGIRRLEESGTSPDEYRVSIERQLQVSVDGNLAFGKTVTLKTPCSEKYPAGGGKALTNGLHGPNDYHCNWLGFEAEHMDAVIDLGRETAFSSVSVGFLQMWYAWIWLPLRVDIAMSTDGTKFTPIASLPNPVADTTSGTFARRFTAEVGTQLARYVRVRALSRLKCPDWHIGAGQKSWIFADEVVIR